MCSEKGTSSIPETSSRLEGKSAITFKLPVSQPRAKKNKKQTKNLKTIYLINAKFTQLYFK